MICGAVQRGHPGQCVSRRPGTGCEQKSDGGYREKNAGGGGEGG